MSAQPLSRLIVTVIAHDRPGIVNNIAEVIKVHGGNWLESNLSSLRGHFAGVILIEIENSQQSQLAQAIGALSNAATTIDIKQLDGSISGDTAEIQEISVNVEANDREGIVEEISNILSANNINVAHIETRIENAPMAGYDLFFAKLLVELPKTTKISQLESALESVSDDLMVNLSN